MLPLETERVTSGQWSPRNDSVFITSVEIMVEDSKRKAKSSNEAIMARLSKLREGLGYQHYTKHQSKIFLLSEREDVTLPLPTVKNVRPEYLCQGCCHVR